MSLQNIYSLKNDIFHLTKSLLDNNTAILFSEEKDGSVVILNKQKQPFAEVLQIGCSKFTCWSLFFDNNSGGLQIN